MPDKRQLKVGDVVSFIDKRAHPQDDWYLQPERWGTVIEARADMDYITVDWRDCGAQRGCAAEDLRLRTPAAEEEKA